jgi:hypothetical protein
MDVFDAELREVSKSENHQDGETLSSQPKDHTIIDCLHLHQEFPFTSFPYTFIVSHQILPTLTPKHMRNKVTALHSHYNPGPSHHHL